MRKIIIQFTVLIIFFLITSFNNEVNDFENKLSFIKKNQKADIVVPTNILISFNELLNQISEEEIIEVPLSTFTATWKKDKNVYTVYYSNIETCIEGSFEYLIIAKFKANGKIIPVRDRGEFANYEIKRFACIRVPF